MIRSVERRSTERVKVMLSATLERAGEATPTRPANLSPDGALVIGAGLSDGRPSSCIATARKCAAPSPGPATTSARVKFEETVDVGSALRTIPSPSRKTAPRTRRPGLKCVPLSEAERATLDRWINTGARALGD